MLAFPEMLIGAATDAGIAVPPDVNDFDRDSYPHWFVYQAMQLGQPLPYPNAFWDNAEVIASIDEGTLKTLTYEELCALGFQIGFPVP